MMRVDLDIFKHFLLFFVENRVFSTVGIGIKTCVRGQIHPGFRNYIVRGLINCIRDTKSLSFVFCDF